MEVEYQCPCGAKFTVEQGSKRRYCDSCILERIKKGRPPKKEEK